MEKSHYYAAIATLVGTIIGAGVLGIPYVVAKAGFLTGLVNIVALGIAVLMLYLYLGETVLRTRGNHQLAGYAGIYLGKTGKRIMVFSMVFGIYGALLAYLIGEGEALSAVFGLNDTLFFSIAFFVIMAVLIYKGLAAVEKSEMILATIVVIIIAVITFFAVPKINASNLGVFSAEKIFVPYGVILFSLAGAIAIPEMKEELRNSRKLLKSAIITGALIPTFIYIVFSLAIVGSMGTGTTEVATVGLADSLGNNIFLLGNIFAALAMATSFLTLGLALKQMYIYDFRLSEKMSWFLTVAPPIVIFFLLEKSFVGVIGITGGIAMGIEGMLIVMIYQKARKIGARKPEFKLARCIIAEYLLIAVFCAGIAYTALSLAGIV